MWRCSGSIINFRGAEMPGAQRCDFSSVMPGELPLNFGRFLISRVIRAATLLLALAVARIPLHAHVEIEEALARLNEHIASAPNDADLYLRRGELYAQHADRVAAEANYLRAAELSPRLARLDLLRGALALEAQRPGEARAHLDRAIALDPREAEAFILRSRSWSAEGHRSRALADFNVALVLLAQPRPELFLERARLCASPAAALRSLDEGIVQVGPVHTLQERALALEDSLGRTDAVLARIDRMMAQAEHRETWLKRRGDVLARAGRTAEARSAYAAALAEIATLPEWLRAAPDTAKLARELARLAPPLPDLT